MIKVKKMFSILAACRSICGKVYFSVSSGLFSSGYAASQRQTRPPEKHGFSANRAASREPKRPLFNATAVFLAIIVIVGVLAASSDAAPVDDLQKNFERPPDD